MKILKYWYWSGLIIAISCLILCLIEKNYIGVAGFLMAISANRICLLYEKSLQKLNDIIEKYK